MRLRAEDGAFDALGQHVLRKAWWHIVPLLACVLLFNYLDKVNLGFAAVTMNGDLGFSNTVFGAGAGAFAIGYVLFGIPSTLALRRWGARRWIALIMVLWGICSASTASVSTPSQLYAVRFALGAAEAGFTPGILLYFTHWFPSRYRGRVLGSFLLIYPLSLVIGGPLSSVCFALDGAQGLRGWQWLFLMEALPSIALAFLVLTFLADSPRRARWLGATERAWLEARLFEEDQLKSANGDGGGRAKELVRQVWFLVMVNLGLSTSGIGAYFFLPLIIHSMGFSARSTGLLVALPGVAAAALLPIWGWCSDRARRRDRVVAFACALIALGLIASAPLLPSAWSLIPLSVVMIGLFGGFVAFWTLPGDRLMGASAAIGIAIINVTGNLGTFIGPYALGWLSDHTESYAAGLVSLAGLAALTAAATVTLGKPKPFLA
jgi:ACS family tartrate transporter-like MFS transporter